MTTHLNIYIFAVIFFATTFWFQLWLLISNKSKNKIASQIVKTKELLSLIKKKTSYSLDCIHISPSAKLFGMMGGLIKPHLILSKALYQQFNTDEREYALFHEMGHFLLRHNHKEVLLGILLLITGSIASYLFNLNIFASFFLGIIFGIIMIRLGRLHEYEADEYSLSLMEHPEAMITATSKFQNQYGKPHNKILETLFFRGNPYQNRIRMAKKEISKRKTI